MEPKTLDHVAFWVADRAPIVALRERHLGMHVIAEEANFTLIGADARRGKLTLFDAEGPRERGAFEARRAARLRPRRGPRGAAGRTRDVFDIGEGILVTLVEAQTDVEYDLDHVALWAADPEATAPRTSATASSAPARRGSRSAARPRASRGRPGAAERPLLNHLAVLVDSADEHVAEARELGIEVESVVDAANTYAAFLWGPDACASSTSSTSRRSA